MLLLLLLYLFLCCCLTGKVVDCRVCGDPNSILRFAFVEFTDEGSHLTKCRNFSPVISVNWSSMDCSDTISTIYILLQKERGLR